MIQLDRITKILLAVIAVSLMILIVRGRQEIAVQPAAYAQSGARTAPLTPTSVSVPLIKEINLNKDIKEIILLGDQKTFLVRVDKGIAVFQVQEYYATSR